MRRYRRRGRDCGAAASISWNRRNQLRRHGEVERLPILDVHGGDADQTPLRVEQAAAACQSLRDQAAELRTLLEFFKLEAAANRYVEDEDRKESGRDVVELHKEAAVT